MGSACSADASARSSRGREESKSVSDNSNSSRVRIVTRGRPVPATSTTDGHVDLSSKSLEAVFNSSTPAEGGSGSRDPFSSLRSAPDGTTPSFPPPSAPSRGGSRTRDGGNGPIIFSQPHRVVDSKTTGKQEGAHARTSEDIHGSAVLLSSGEATPRGVAPREQAPSETCLAGDLAGSGATSPNINKNNNSFGEGSTVPLPDFMAFSDSMTKQSATTLDVNF